ncbi:MAG: hypothetical protein A2W91_09205 [Bacteroidetes bacterium GWF2_38_335]|nr:MAG: hypothetical protein A2W91_09205 [Bacteroidetes bacterium GWF2_38_335]OFY80545.1 MAG: hypothetical protein A2281_08930 [Bacteroidetes bacterium RIFOXYA12_FULL_38_20]HBS85840.1 hypothetical protein [Bacteroidales bacterium]
MDSSSHFMIRGEIEQFISANIRNCKYFSFVTSSEQVFENKDNLVIKTEWLLKTKEIKILIEFKKVLVEKFGQLPEFRESNTPVAPDHRFLLLIIE